MYMLQPHNLLFQQMFNNFSMWLKLLYHWTPRQFVTSTQRAELLPRCGDARLPVLLDPTGKILDFPMVMPQAPLEFPLDDVSNNGVWEQNLLLMSIIHYHCLYIFV